MEGYQITGTSLYYELYEDDDVWDIDEDGVIHIPKNKIIMQGDKASRYIPFRLKRYRDGIDLAEKMFYVVYNTSDGRADSPATVNTYMNDEYIRTAWLLDGDEAVEACTLSFQLLASGLNEKEDPYGYHSQIKTLEVLPSLNKDIIISDKPQLFTDLMNYVQGVLDGSTGTIYAKLSRNMAVMEARISEIAATAGTNTADTEIGDARVRMNGTSAECLGDEVRAKADGFVLEGTVLFLTSSGIKLSEEGIQLTDAMTAYLTEAHTREVLKGYIPVGANSEIVKNIEKTDGGIKVTMRDGYEFPIEMSNAKEFETVEYDKDTCLLHFYDVNGEDVYDPVYIESGGGGGGGASYAVTLKNLLESRNFSVSESSDAYLQFEYSSVDADGEDDGPGVGTILVGGVRKATVNVVQGTNNINVKDYLSSGSNSVKIRVENSEGIPKSLNYTINVISLSVTTTLDTFMNCSGDVTFYYRVIGTGSKTIKFIMDGEEIGSTTTESSGKSLSFVIPEQAHGGHVFECYAETEVDGIAVQSEPVRLAMIWVDSADMTPGIVSLFNVETATQGEALFIPYIAYDPLTETPEVVYTILNEDGTEYSKQERTIDRTAQEWIVQDYPVGNVKFRISIGEIYVEFGVAVAASDVKIETVTDSLVLDFNPQGRSNQEDNPAVWTDGTTTATFSDVGFSGSDGWMNDESGSTMFRLLPGGEMVLPFAFFATDKRDAGATIEVEMATHNVRDYDSVVISSMSGGRGIKIASQYAQLNSEQSEISMQFVEDKRIRVSFVIEPKNLNRLIYVYVNGIMSGALQYPEADNFAQNPAVGLTIGAESSGIDIYRILMYEKGLVATELTGNFVADRPTFKERLDAHTRNDILNTSEDVVISKLPATLPYMIISCPELPQYKGDKKTCSIEYVNLSDTSRSFTAENVQIDVQGTSSSGYKKKNFKEKYRNGVKYTATGATAEGYSIRADSIPVAEVCMKADVASSEGANNVELVRLYNDVCLTIYMTAAQIADPRVRVGIDGVPCVVFWNNTDTGEIKFWGKYNFNNEKANSEVYGLTEGCESWEILNNVSERVLFKSSDFSGTEWTKDFEARYPEDNTDTTNLKRMMDWVVSTDREAVSSEEEKQARLDKFVAEFEDYFIKDAMIFYYIFTEVFMMVDSRAKNFFPSTFDGIHWMPLPYDMDTAIGINNEGALVFDYDLEDDDEVGGKDVFNSRHSTLWCNIRDGFASDIKAMYQSLRSQTNTLFSYEKIIERFDEHQSVWPETIWNEDAYEKYLEPLLSDKDGSYLSMMQGDKSSQREWWLYNGFRYRDSKYQCGDANSNYVTIRCYQAGPITVTPYSHIWPRIQYDGSVGASDGYVLTEKGKRNVPMTFQCPMTTLNDTPVYIFSADRLGDIGDLSGLKVGWANFSAATKLMKLKLGDGAESYENPNLETLQIGNNELLVELDVRKCTNLKQTIDVSECTGIEKIYASGSAITAVTLPVGGKVKELELPGTITNLTIRNHKQLETLTVAGYDKLTTLRVENTPNIPIEDIITSAGALERVRMVGIEWNVTDEAALQSIITKLESCGGMDASAGNTDKAVVNGRVYIDAISNELLEHIFDTFPELVVVVAGEVKYLVRFLGADGTVLYKQQVAEGEDAVDPVANGSIETPTKTGTDDVGYAYTGWSSIPTNVHANVSVVAQFTTAWAVRFYNGDTLLDTQWIVNGASATDPVASGKVSTPTKSSTAQYTYSYSGWDRSLSNITGATNINAQFTSTVRKYTVYFYNGSTLLQTVTDVAYGSSATYTGDTPVSNLGSADEYPFIGWSPQPTNIVGNTSCYAQFSSPLEIAEITDSWDEIFAAIDDGSYVTKYSVGNYKPLDLGSEGIVNMQIAAKDTDVLADGSGTAPITWISKELLTTSHRMNPALVSKKTISYDPEGTYLWSAVEGVDNSFESTNAGVGSSTSSGCWKITSESAGTLQIAYTQSGESSYDYMDLYVDGVSAFSGKTAGQDASGTYEVALVPGAEIIVLASFTKDSSGDKGNDKGVVTFSSDVSISVAMATESTSIVIPAQEGTGTIGGWEKTEMRAYLDDTVKPLIPESVRNRIKEVNKYTRIYDTNESAVNNVVTVDDVWIPSYREAFGGTSLETEGPAYTTLFADNASRIKYKVGATSASYWWLRSASANGNFRSVSTSGADTGNGAGNSFGVALGFCT